MSPTGGTAQPAVQSQVHVRATWSNPIEFILSCMGYAIGLGNVWRFPYLCYRNGGGAFLISYIIMMILMGMPIFLLELVVGQYSGLGPNQAFARLAPIFSGLGYCTLVVITLVTIYYMVIIAWTLFYFFASFQSELGWGSCDHDFNSISCYSGISDDDCKSSNNTLIYWNRTCTSIIDVCSYYNTTYVNRSDCLVDGKLRNIAEVARRKLSSQEYFNDYMLGVRNATWENYGGFNWQIFLCLLLAWIIAYACVVRGVKTSGKAVYFTALFPYVMLTALLIRGATLENASDGIILFLKPDWSSLLSPTVWGHAASQTFYSFGIGCGSLITLSSYSAFKNDCHKDAVLVSLANLFTSLYAGLAIFAVLGFLASEMNVPVSDVATDGPGLAFVAYPEAVLRMPVPQLWASMFFLMLITLGLGSQFAGIEAISTAVLDKWPHLRKHQALVVLGICTSCFMLALPMCFDGGVYMFTLLEWNTASWAVILICFLEVIVVSWCYGCNRFLENMVTMDILLPKLIRNLWWVCWVVLTPLTCVGAFIFTMMGLTTAFYEDYVFPSWANALGWLIGASTLLPLPVFAIYVLTKKEHRGKDFITPTKKWGPAPDTVKDNNSMESLTKSSIKSSLPEVA